MREAERERERVRAKGVCTEHALLEEPWCMALVSSVGLFLCPVAFAEEGPQLNRSHVNAS